MKELIEKYVPIILGSYEVFIRSIKTKGDYTVLGNIIRVISKLSDFLNNKKGK